ncbi:MAG: Rpp14/Pop5 family protein [Candidatus Bathyarchaeia archaeon]
MRRLKKRYLALTTESSTGQTFSEREVWDALWRSVLRLFGEVGASQLGLFRVRGFDAPGGVLLVRCWHTALERVRGAAALVRGITGEPAAVHVLGVSGTLKGLEQKLRACEVSSRE